MNMEEMVVTEDVVKEAEAILDEYKQGKESIDARVTENQEWWRIRHASYTKGSNAAAATDESPVSAWLFNSLINKHADIMDNFPKPNILPREADDEEEAQSLSKIIPVILEQNDYESVYSQKGYDLLIEGGMITSVVWDQQKRNGLGDVTVKNVDVHNIFWQPGITDIQDSDNVFSVKLMDAELLRQQFPQKAEFITPTDNAKAVKYIHDDNIDTTKCVEVIDWYYKKTIMVDAAVDEEGNSMLQVPKTILHYCKFSCGQVLYASENVEEYAAEGYYWHGKYPFVVDTLFPVKDSLWGFGFLDVMKPPQKYIDRLDQVILKNAFMVGQPRFWVKESAGVNIEDFLDWNKPVVKMQGGDLNDMVRAIDVNTIPAHIINQRDAKIEELKETSGNRDFSQGSTSSGVTAASAIAALQEAGSKIARDVNKVCYRSKRDETYLVVELVRQFMTEERTFRVDSDNGGYEFVNYQSTANAYQNVMFDIKIVAEKQSPFSRAAQNELAKEMYSLGWFNPQMAEASLIAIDMMEFEGKEKIKAQIQQNSLMMQQLQRMMQVIAETDAMFPQLQLGARAGLAPPPGMGVQPESEPQAPSGQRNEGTPEERVARKESDSTLAANARKKAAKASEIK